MNRLSWSGICLAGALVGCGGGSTPPAESPDDTSVEVIDPEPEPMEPEEAPEAEEATEDVEEAAPPEEKPAEVEFPENASVNQAINAVPPGAERVNLDPEELGRPLQDPKVYEPCKVGGQHFKLRVAVWNGRAVGIDVDTPNAALAECIKTQVRNLEWRDKVPSLNTIEFGM